MLSTQAVKIGSRYKTGQRCPVSGVYAFDGYVDGSVYPQPTWQEREIPLSEGEIFPPVRSCGKAAWWKLVRYA